MRSLRAPYWCKGSPLRWADGGIGLAHLATEGRVGLFNLGWLMLQREQPPSAVVYRNTDLRWVIVQAGGMFIEKRSLEEHAAFKTEQQFHRMVLRFTSGSIPVNIPGHVPWATLREFALNKETS
jgi:hypothetical protein